MSTQPSLGQDVMELISEEPDEVALLTGHRSFDLLNAQLGLKEYYGFILGQGTRVSLSLCFPDHLNIPAAAAAYDALVGVRGANASSLGGDGPDIELDEVNGTWFAVFRDAWGDCPSGCIGEELFFFTVAGGQVTELEEKSALSDATFIELLQRLFPFRDF